MKLRFAALALGVGLVLRVAVAQTQPNSLRTYRDPQNRFEFAYPAAFGTPLPGTDDGFLDRQAAIRFSEFSAGVQTGVVLGGQVLGGEAVLTRGAPQLDLQVAGGLYDAITLQIFPAPVASAIRNALPVLSASTFCDALARERHLDAADPRLPMLTAQQRATLASVDQMGNHNGKVLRCYVMGGTVTFVKAAAAEAGGPLRHIYGAVRFVAAPYSSFHLIRGSRDAPGGSLLEQITAVVNSWKRL